MHIQSPDNENLQPPTSQKKRIGPYLICQGTFGKVKLAQHQLTNQYVAIKILQKSKIAQVSDIERVSRQIHILKLMRHPNIIQLYEIIETQRYLFLVMEYCSGGDLFDYICSEKKLTEEEGCRFFHQMISGLEYMHRLKIVHRDLKPENMLLDAHKNIKIVDFGLSNTYSQLERRLQEGANKTIFEQLKTACGSPCYAAPEMIGGKKYSGLMVDLWSLGIILYAMLSGCLPFEDQNTSHLYKKILNLDYLMPQQFSKPAKSLVSGILTQPQKRLTIEQIKQHPFYKKIPSNEHGGLVVGINNIPVDEKILQMTVRLGFEKEYVRKCIETNRHNAATTAYFLVMGRKRRDGFASEADLNSNKFDPRLIVPDRKISKKQGQGLETKHTVNQSSIDDLIKNKIEFEDQPATNHRSTRSNRYHLQMPSRRSMNMSKLSIGSTSRSKMSKNLKIGSTKASVNLSVEKGLLELQLPVIGLQPKKKKKIYRGICETPRHC